MRNLFRAVIVSALLAAPVQAQQSWATLKGRVVWDGKSTPKPKEIKIQRCVRPGKKGPLFEKTYVINPKNKGVRWVQVYLGIVDAQGKVDPNGTMPIHPTLQKIKNKTIVIDQPCCEFEPHVLGLRVGQTLLVKNSSKADGHNSKIDGDNVRAPRANPLIPAGSEIPFVGPWKPHHFPVPIGCTIHPWMKAYVRVFNHPYYAVTDADGKFEIKNVPVSKDVRLIFWHPEEGWFYGDFRNGKPLAKPSPKGVIDLNEVKLIPENE